MAKANITLRDGRTVTIISEPDTFVNLDTEKNPDVSPASNTRRINKFSDSIETAIRGSRRVVAVEVANTEDARENVLVLDHTLVGSDDKGNIVFINGADIVSAVITD